MFRHGIHQRLKAMAILFGFPANPAQRESVITNIVRVPAGNECFGVRMEECRKWQPCN
jgi:hypothetical protein